MNVVTLIGRLTRDPEVKSGQSGKQYARFSIAVDRPFQKGEADFINCVAFGKTAELIGEYLRKGSKLGLNGSLQMNRYEANGEKRTSYDVVVNNVEFLDSKDSGSENGGGYSKPAVKEEPKRAVKQEYTNYTEQDEEDFPF